MTATWSLFVPTSNCRMLALFKPRSLVMVSVPEPLLPGASVAPAAKETCPPIVPLPPSAPPGLMLTEPEPVPLPVVLLTNNVPPLTVVAPEKVLLPPSASEPGPLKTRAVAAAPPSEIVPLKTLLVFTPPMTNVVRLALAVVAPARPVFGPPNTAPK